MDVAGSSPVAPATLFYKAGRNIIMTYYVYIIFSSKLGKFYTGISKFSGKRYRQHNSGKTCWTSQADDWIEVWRQHVDDASKARELEVKIKKRGAKRFLVDKGVAVPPLAE